MIAYKFRGSDQIPFALDIILMRRLYCAHWRNLNDPMEGKFTYSLTRSTAEGTLSGDSSDDWMDEIGEQTVKELDKRKVCSLSLTAESRRLWAHYASGFDGLAIEIELPDEAHEIEKVEYLPNIPDVNLNLGRDIPEEADRILTTKQIEWEYEQEVRIVQNSDTFYLEKGIKRVICGPRMGSAMFTSLQIICNDKQIPINRMYIDHEGVDLTGERNPSIKLRRALMQSIKANTHHEGGSNAASSGKSSS